MEINNRNNNYNIQWHKIKKYRPLLKNSKNLTYINYYNRLISNFRVMQTIVINNITALLHTTSKFDLLLLSQKISNGIYNKKRFPGLIIRKHSPKSTYLVFQSGKIIILGCESVKDAQCAGKKIMKTISKILNQKVQQQCFSITNILGSAVLRKIYVIQAFKINIAKLADQTNSVKHDSYPAVIYFMKSPVKSVSIFPSGKIILIGAKQIKNIEDAVQILQRDLLKFKKSQISLQQNQTKKIKKQKKVLKKKLLKQVRNQDNQVDQGVQDDQGLQVCQDDQDETVEY